MSATAADVAERYFTPAEPSFWRWVGKNCAEIEGTWEPGTLLAFREELLSILTALQPQGWPPLSSLLLIMAATRTSWSTSGHVLVDIFNGSSPDNPFVRDVINQLDRLHALPADLRDSTAAKIRLATVIFEGSRAVLDADQAKSALAYFGSVLPHSLSDPWIGQQKPAPIPVRFADWTRSLRIGLARLSEETLRSRQLTGLDHAVIPAPIPEPALLPLPDSPTTHAARLWSWSHDPQLYGVARIARQLISVVTWPRRLSQADDLPLGGVSDLTNRGPLDRLLLTELAQDNDSLMVRIALNEALYLRRECPRQETPHHRAILVDAGLRMWGRPRVFGAAVALAMAAAQDREANLLVDVAVTTREGWQPADITTRDGAVELLGALSPTLHPGEWLEEWRINNEVDERDCEFVLITTPDVLRQPEFQQQLKELPVDYRIALVDGQGRFELRSHSAHGWRTEFTAKLDLDELLTPPVDARPLPLKASAPDRYPAIMRTEPFPLLFTHQLESQFCFPAAYDVMISLASAGRVLLWDGPKQGGRQLAMDVPRGRVESWADIDTGQTPQTYAVLRARRWLLLKIDVGTFACETVELKSDWSPSDPTVRAVLLPECVVLISKRGVAAFAFATGEQIDIWTDERPLICHGNRYLSDSSGHWYRLSCDDELYFAPVKTKKPALLLIDPHPGLGVEGPLEVSTDGSRDVATDTVPPFIGGNYQSAEQRGDFVCLIGNFEFPNHPHRLPRCAIWNVQSRPSAWSHLVKTYEAGLHEKITARFQTRPALRTKFTGVVCTGDMVCLVSSKQKWWRLKPVDDKLMLVTQSMVTQPMPPNLPMEPWPVVPFERLRWPGMPIVMHTAKLENGNTVWLDSRGLLHLLPESTSRPEITLVLDAETLSGWMSDGRRFGDPYYLTDHREDEVLLSVSTVWRTEIAPFFGIRP